MNKELEEAKQNLINQLENTKIANECGLATKGEFSKDIKAIETVLNYIDNSISKEVIKEKIEKYKQQLKNNIKRVVQLQILEQNGVLQQSEWEELNMLFGDIEKIRGKIEALEELLKKNY